MKSLRASIALLLVAANLPVIALAVWIGVRDFRAADTIDRDRLVQAAELVAARASGFPADGSPPSEAARRTAFQDGASRTMVAVAVVGPDGRVVAQDDATPLGDRWLPAAGLPAARLDADERIRKARGADGRAYRYALSPVGDGGAMGIAATPFDFSGRSQTQWLLLALGLPALMSLLCVGLVLLGIERFVLRWIRMLRTTAEAHDGGRLDVRAVKLEGAPAELARLGDALDGMSQRIEERSTALRSAVEDRDRLLRELHHRVKNNFQMIASLLALQRQEAPQSLSAVLRAPEDRVRAMASAYKASYAGGEIGHVDVGELVRDVALQARDSGGDKAFHAEVHLPEEVGEIDLDRAVSLALLAMELLSAAGGAGSSARVTIAPYGDDRLSLSIEGPPDGWLPTAGLPSRLIRAYADQLGSAIDESVPGVVSVSFKLASEKPSIGMKPRKPAAN